MNFGFYQSKIPTITLMLYHATDGKEKIKRILTNTG